MCDNSYYNTQQYHVYVVYERNGMAMTTGAWTLGLVLGPAVGGEHIVTATIND